MATVFISGSMSIKHLHPEVKARIDNIVVSGLDIVVGDADGVDASIQEYLKAHGGSRITVYCSGSLPRNNIGHWPIWTVQTKHTEGSRGFFTAKDLAMAEAADYGLMIWDTKSAGTLSNVLELLSRKKKSVIFINKEKVFKTITNVDELEALISCMSPHARAKADEKIKLSDRLLSLKHEQSELFII